jgi:centromeric protein E
MAYGPTGSGKTYNMMGTSSCPGVIPRVLEGVFSGIEQRSATREYMVRCSYLEVYNERLQDLLTPGSKDLAIKENPSGFYVEGLSEAILSSKGPDEVLALVRRAGAVGMHRQRGHQASGVYDHRLFRNREGGDRGW